MRYIILALTLIITVQTEASKSSCLVQLTHNHVVGSRAFKINTDEIDVLGDERDYLAQGISIVRGMLDLEGCDGQNDINFGHLSVGKAVSSCRKLVRGRSYSVSCYIESDLGYFFVTRDLETNAFVVFNRWD